MSDNNNNKDLPMGGEEDLGGESVGGQAGPGTGEARGSEATQESIEVKEEKKDEEEEEKKNEGEGAANSIQSPFLSCFCLKTNV